MKYLISSRKFLYVWRRCSLSNLLPVSVSRRINVFRAIEALTTASEPACSILGREGFRVHDDVRPSSIFAARGRGRGAHCCGIRIVRVDFH
jgi:hypothetical protein